jgi:hypothetical protein
VFGGEARHEAAKVSYDRRERVRAVVSQTQVMLIDTTRTAVSADPNGLRLSAYAALRVRPVERVTAELGVRTDHHDWTKQTTVSPRLNIALDVAGFAADKMVMGHRDANGWLAFEMTLLFFVIGLTQLVEQY